MSAFAEVTERKGSRTRKRRVAMEPARAPRAVEPSVSPRERLPYLLDLYPLESPTQTRLAPFFDALREGRFVTTRCRKDGKVLWPPRIVCPACHSGELEWVDLPTTGRIYAFSALLAGAPIGQEAELPLVVGLVELDGSPLRLFGRFLGIDWRECRIGLPVAFEALTLPDGRAYFAFRVKP
ncbi:MAG: Zn-ribbon domain-containing OB-fold protein [Thermoplasmata archaeon]|nr:Zn-ribbon domain-containing OB-fold protein [Thermoplasmata archaeon]